MRAHNQSNDEAKSNDQAGWWCDGEAVGATMLPEAAGGQAMDRPSMLMAMSEVVGCRG